MQLSYPPTTKGQFPEDKLLAFGNWASPLPWLGTHRVTD